MNEAVKRAEKAIAERDDALARLTAAEAQVGALTEALVDHNDMLRSAMQICERAIMHEEFRVLANWDEYEEFRVLANWDAFHDRVSVTLKKHHAVTNKARAALASVRGDNE